MRVADVVRGFTSFWNDTIPFCDVAVAEINKHLCATFQSPLVSTTSGSRHALVNELGFELFRAAVGSTESASLVAQRPDELNRLMTGVRDHLAQFAGTQPKPCSEKEVREAVELASRLEAFFSQYGDLKTRLYIAGCGSLSACEADAWADRTLYEIKAGDRPFLGADIRQLLVYCAINSESRQYEIERVCLVNPRRGKYYAADVEDLCIRVAGAGRYEVTNRIINLLTDAGAYS
jgi:hypothetical protein